MFSIETKSSTIDLPLFVALNSRLALAGARALEERGYRQFIWTTDRDQALTFETIIDAERYLQMNPSLIGAVVISWDQDFLLPDQQSRRELRP